MVVDDGEVAAAKEGGGEAIEGNRWVGRGKVVGPDLACLFRGREGVDQCYWESGKVAAQGKACFRSRKEREGVCRMTALHPKQQQRNAKRRVQFRRGKAAQALSSSADLLGSLFVSPCVSA